MNWPPPFRSVERPGAVFAWAAYDLANQSFQLLINTLLFPVFFARIIVGDPDRGRSVWFTASAAALMLVVLLSPIVGAISDQRAWKRELLLATGAVCAALTVLLGLTAPGQVWIAAVVYVIAAVACGLGENLLGAFLPEISTPATIGRVSAIGWTTSYIGAVLLLGITALVTLGLGRTDASDMRPLIVFAGIWFGCGMLPALFMLRETPARPPAVDHPSSALGRIAQSVREARRHPQLARFLLAFGVYSAGTMTMIYGLGLIGDRLGFGIDRLILMGVVIALTGGCSAAIAGRFQDRLGHRRTIAAFLIVWIAATLFMSGAAFMHVPEIGYWIVAAMIGFALGGIGTASRAMVGALTPPDRAGEAFGLWGMVSKLAGIVGVLAFGQVSGAIGQPVALLAVAGMFAAGLALLFRVDEQRGIHAAATPREYTPEYDPR